MVLWCGNHSASIVTLLLAANRQPTRWADKKCGFVSPNCLVGFFQMLGIERQNIELRWYKRRNENVERPRNCWPVISCRHPDYHGTGRFTAWLSLVNIRILESWTRKVWSCDRKTPSQTYLTGDEPDRSPENDGRNLQTRTTIQPERSRLSKDLGLAWTWD